MTIAVLEPPLYLDTAATTPPAAAVLAAMEAAQRQAWGNPSSLHGVGLAAAECLERSRSQVAAALGSHPEEVIFTSGGTESIHLALQGVAASLTPGRLLISAVEHPATLGAAQALERRGWQVQTLPVDRQGRLDLEQLEALLRPPTRLMSLIWGQSEVGTLQPLQAVGERCRAAGVLLHVDAVQVAATLPIAFGRLPVDLLSCAAHKLQGPRGIGALLVRQGVRMQPLLAGGGQERGLRAGTESVVLAAGMAAALGLVHQRRAGGIAAVRDALLSALLALPGVELTGALVGPERLPHHISLLLRSATGRPLSGRAVVRALARRGIASSSGSACSSQADPASPVLRALGYGSEEAQAGLRLSLGAWHRTADLIAVPRELAEVITALSQGAG